MAATVADLDYSYDGSDESSENELLNRSLSVWKGGCLANENFVPIPLDLHTAASIGQYDCVHALIKRRDILLNQKNKGGWTALMYASYIGHENIVTLLLEARVSVNVKSSKGQTPLMLAASCGNEGVAYFLLQAGADLEARDKQGWTALFHATASGHQNMVKFLLDNGADTEAAEPAREFTPFLEAAAAGHEIIVQYFLQHGVDLNVKSSSGDTARSQAMMAGHTKIVTLIDNHTVAGDSSSSDEGGQGSRGHGQRSARSRTRGPNIREGPEALAQLFSQAKQGTPTQSHPLEQHGTEQQPNVRVPTGYMTFADVGNAAANTDEISFRDVTSPINPDDYTVHCPTSSDAEHEKDGTAFSKTGALTIKSSSGSSGGLVAALGLSRRNSSDSGNDELSSDGNARDGSIDVPRQSPTIDAGPSLVTGQCGDGVACDGGVTRKCQGGDTVDQNDSVKQWQKNHFGNGGNTHEVPCTATDARDARPCTATDGPVRDARPCTATDGPIRDARPGLMSTPEDLGTLLRQVGLTKYLGTFDEQDVDLQVFLSLTDNDLKEVGIRLFGPRRKMTNAIARWHSNARHHSSGLEQAYADRMEAEMQEMAIQVHKAYDQMDVLSQQVLQERELRSVTEGWLMEDRATWQEVSRLAADTRTTGCNMTTLLDTVRRYEQEMAVRLGTLPATATAHGGGNDSLAAALKEGLSLDENPRSTPAMRAQSTEEIGECLEKYHSELNGAAFTTVLNADKILSRTEHCGAMGAFAS